MAHWWRGGRIDHGPGRGNERLTVGFVGRAMLVVIALWALASMIWLGRTILFVAFFGVLFALFLSIFVEPLVRWWMSRLIATLVVLLAIIWILIFLVWLSWPTLHTQITEMREQLPNAILAAEVWLQDTYARIVGESVRPTMTIEQEVRERLGQQIGSILVGALPVLRTAAEAIVGIVLIIFTGVYLVVEPRTYMKGLVRLVPPEGRARFARALQEAGRDLRLWIIGTAINMVIIGILTTVGLALLGVPAAFALGLIALFLEFIPFYGPWLSAIPALGVALLLSPSKALWVAILYLGIHEVEGNLLAPLVMKATVRVPPMLTLLIGAFMAILFGALGLILAVPLLVMTMVLLERLYIEPLEERAEAGSMESPPSAPQADVA